MTDWSFIMGQKDDIKKQKIIRAAAKVFSDQGLEKARVSDIAKKANIAKGTVYLYFKSKEEILIEGVKYFAQERISSLKKILSNYPTPSEKLLKMFEFNKKLAQKDPDVFFMNYASLLSTHDSLKKQSIKVFFDKYIELVVEIIREGIYKGEFKICDPHSTALAFVLAFDMSTIIRGKTTIKGENLIELIRL